MASIYRKTLSPYWFAAYRGADGKRVNRTTKETLRKSAQAKADAWEKLASKGLAGTLSEANARQVVSDIVEQTTGRGVEFHTCKSWVAAWLDDRRGTASPATVERYDQITDDFLTHLGERAALPLPSVRADDVRAFRDEYAKQGRAPSTVNIARKVLAMAFRAATLRGFISINPALLCSPLADNRDRKRDAFTAEQVAKLLEHSANEWRGVILLAFTSGLRLRDITLLTWNNVDMAAQVVNVRTSKTGRVLSIPMHPDFIEWMGKQSAGVGRAPLFGTLAAKGSGGEHGLSGRFKAIMVKAGIVGRAVRSGEKAGRKTFSLSFHSLRHGCISALAGAGVPEEMRREISGHADPATHRTYTHLEVTAIREAVHRIPRLLPAA